MKIKHERSVVVELTAAEVIDACRQYVLARRAEYEILTYGLAAPRLELTTADGFDDHERVFSLTFKVMS